MTYEHEATTQNETETQSSGTVVKVLSFTALVFGVAAASIAVRAVGNALADAING